MLGFQFLSSMFYGSLPFLNRCTREGVLTSVPVKYYLKKKKKKCRSA